MKLPRPDEIVEFEKMRELTPEDRADTYRFARELLAAGDLQKYIDVNDSVPLQDVLNELEKQQQEIDITENDD